MTAERDSAIGMRAALAAGASAFIEKRAVADVLPPAINAHARIDRRDVV